MPVSLPSGMFKMRRLDRRELFFQVLQTILEKFVLRLHGFDGRFKVSRSKFSPTIVSVAVSRLLNELTSPRSASTEDCSGWNEVCISIVISSFILVRWISSSEASCCIGTGSLSPSMAEWVVSPGDDSEPAAIFASFLDSAEARVVWLWILLACSVSMSFLHPNVCVRSTFDHLLCGNSKTQSRS